MASLQRNEPYPHRGTVGEVSTAEEMGPYGLVVPFNPKPLVLPVEVIELYQWLLHRETPDYLLENPEKETELKRRARLLLALHDDAVKERRCARTRVVAIRRIWRRWARRTRPRWTRQADSAGKPEVHA